jgi:CheY-like chemotaxis protein
MLDWKLPGIDGQEAALRIRRLAGRAKAPRLILVASDGRDEIRRQAEQAGMDGFLIKPFSPSAMLDAILRVLGQKATNNRRADAGNEPSPVAAESLAGACVLLVEDNEINQQVAVEILAGAGVKVIVASNGREALDFLKFNRCDAILMDVQMPVMDGYTATQAIRKWEKESPEEGRPPIPIIAMTAHAIFGDREKSLTAGMNDHITKPIDPAQLFGTLGRWLGRNEAPRRAVVVAAADQRRGPEPVLPARLAGFDLADGLRRLKGNRALYGRLLVNFADQHRQTADDIRTALETGDFERACRLAHTLKGVAANLSAYEVQAAAARLERMLTGHDPVALPAAGDVDAGCELLLAALRGALAAVASLAPVAEVVETPARPIPAILPPGLPHETLARLRTAVELGDVDGIQAAAQELSIRVGTFGGHAERIQALADDLNFEEIFKLLGELERAAVR